MDGSRDDPSAPDSSCSPFEQGRESKARCVWNPKNELTDKAEIDPQTQKTNAWLPKAKGEEGSRRLQNLVSVPRPCHRAILVTHDFSFSNWC